MHLPPFSKSSAHITNALELASRRRAVGVLSGVHYTPDGHAVGFVYGHASLENERQVLTSFVTLFADEGICTESGSYYVVADHRDEQALLDRERLSANLLRYEQAQAALRRGPPQHFGGKFLD